MLYFIIFLMLLICVLGAGLLLLMLQSTARENRQMELQMLSMEALYSALEKRITGFRRYRHDLAKHIHTLEQILKTQQESCTDVEALVAEMKQKYSGLAASPICSDGILNALLTVKAEECVRKEIPLTLSVTGDRFEILSGIDMVSVVYNLLDNAIEACEELPREDRCLCFSMAETAGVLEIRLENRFSPERFADFRTTKGKPEDHGLGMEIISSVTDRQGGHWEIQLDRKRGMLYQVLTFPQKRRAD